MPLGSEIIADPGLQVASRESIIDASMMMRSLLCSQTRCASRMMSLQLASDSP